MNTQKVSPSFCAWMQYNGLCQWKIDGKLRSREDTANFNSNFVLKAENIDDGQKGTKLTFKNSDILKLFNITPKEYYDAARRAKLAGSHIDSSPYEFSDKNFNMVG